MKKTFALTLALCLPMAAVMAADNPDALFFRKATQGGIAEIDGGMLAQQLGSTQAVKDFGNMMVRDHTAANHGLRNLAETKQVDLPALPSTEDAAQRSKLSALSGADFDRHYIEWQILAHRDAIALFKEESASGDDIDARQFATDTLPRLQSHLALLMAMPMSTPAPAAAGSAL